MTRGLRWEWERGFLAAPLASGAKLVGLVMATFGDPDGTGIYPSTVRLAEACGMNVKTVRKHRDELEDAGWIRAARNNKGGRGRSNEYRLAVPETLPTGGRVCTPETRPDNGGVSGGETRPFGAEKPDQMTPVNPPSRWTTTRPDQTIGPEGRSAGPRPDAGFAPGSHLVVKMASHRRSADARDGDDADASRDVEHHPYQETGFVVATPDAIARARALRQETQL